MKNKMNAERKRAAKGKTEKERIKQMESIANYKQS